MENWVRECRLELLFLRARPAGPAGPVKTGKMRLSTPQCSAMLAWRCTPGLQRSGRRLHPNGQTCTQRSVRDSQSDRYIEVDRYSRGFSYIPHHHQYFQLFYCTATFVNILNTMNLFPDHYILITSRKIDRCLGVEAKICINSKVKRDYVAG